MPACDVAHVNDPVRCEGEVAEVDELVDKVVRAHGGYGCGQGGGGCVWADDMTWQNWMKDG